MTTESGARVQDENDQIRFRREKRELLAARGIRLYPSSYPVTHTAEAAIAAYADGGAPVKPSVAGRVVSRRKMGRASFLHVLDRTAQLQIYLREDAVGAAAYEALDLVDLGDFLGATGTMMRTRAGEVTLQAEEWTFLAKAMRPLPEKWHGLADKEIRFRQRYLDLVVNEEARRVFRARSRMVSAMRRVLDAKDFLEVETPVLQPIHGGATARPFRTLHHALGVTLFLRIANELYLKRCLVGGLERVYEFAKDFRNEGMDRTHQPEFTMVEMYEAYADYRAGMALTEELLLAACESANGSPRSEYRGRSLDFSRPWRRLPFFDALEAATGRDLSRLDGPELAAALRARGVEPAPGATPARLADELFSAVVQPELFEPTFVTDHPKALSPLAKERADAAHLVERFEPYLAGMEVGNGFSELNDPYEQRARFLEQIARGGREEDTMALDEPFLRALEHGMPPASGLGLGIDRIAMGLTGQEQIREVILFPQMRPEAEPGETDGAAS